MIAPGANKKKLLNGILISFALLVVCGLSPDDKRIQSAAPRAAALPKAAETVAEKPAQARSVDIASPYQPSTEHQSPTPPPTLPPAAPHRGAADASPLQSGKQKYAQRRATPRAGLNPIRQPNELMVSIHVPDKDKPKWISPTPSMPALNISGAIQGVHGPVSPVEYLWTVRFLYDLRQKRSARTSIKRESPLTGRSTTAQMPDIFKGKIRGGRMFVSLEIKMSDGQSHKSREVEGPMILGENPSKQAILNQLKTSDPEETSWLQKIACKESGNFTHFATFTNSTNYQYIGEPRMSLNGDGGVGLMQITNQSVSPEVLWDWRQNINHSKNMFQEKKNSSKTAISDIEKSTLFRVVMEKTNEERRRQGHPPLNDILVPPFSWYRLPDANGKMVDTNLLLEDTVRAYNGYGSSKRQTKLGRFRLRYHEFRLKLISDSVLAVKNERVTATGRRVADAIWERTPLSERPRSGNLNYVEDVRKVDVARDCIPPPKRR